MGGVTEFGRNELQELDVRGFAPEQEPVGHREHPEVTRTKVEIATSTSEGFSERDRVVVVYRDDGSTFLGELFRLRVFGRLSCEQETTTTLAISHGTE